jgi:hypothetical protein
MHAKVTEAEPAHRAPGPLRDTATRIRFARSIHVPEDGICLSVFDAPTARDAAHAAERAGLDFRVVEAVSTVEEKR